MGYLNNTGLARFWAGIKSRIANNLTTTGAGYFLDARQGKALNDKLAQANTYTLLYTNASPASAFGEQTLAVNLSGYNHVMIEYFANGSWFNHVARVNVPIGRTGAMAIALAEYNNLRICHRTATPTATGVAFSPGYVRGAADGNAGTQNNQCSVPYRIWGVKGV